MQALFASFAALVLAVQVAAAQDVPQSRADIALSFAPVVRAATPAVVSIYASRIVDQWRPPFLDDPIFGQLFRDFGASSRVQNALGSGVIVAPEGIVVSNFHVVGGADEIRVVLDDRREYAADLVLADEESDLAVLRLRGARDLPALALADSDALEVGDLVLAIGNPFGVGQTVSMGIVSALARSGISVGSGRGSFIQTDAAINPGNSGGALVGMDGRLAGINTAILTRSGGSNGIGFAIPANLVAQVVAQAQAGNARFLRPWAGMTGQAMDAALAEAFGLDLPQGVVVADLHPLSPLMVAGIGAGDVILAIDGVAVNTPPELMYRLSARGIGGEVELDVLRDGTRMRMRVPLAPAPEVPPRARLELSGNWPLRGLIAETVNPAVSAEYDLPGTVQGVVVVAARDVARQVGLSQGDVILSVNRVPVPSTADLEVALSRQARSWEIEILREGRRTLIRFRW